MHRSLPSLALVLAMLPGCDTTDVGSPKSAGGGKADEYSEGDTDTDTGENGGETDGEAGFEPALVECTPDTPVFGRFPDDIRPFVTQTETFTRADVASLGELRTLQLFDAVVRHGYATPDQSPSVAFDVTDDGQLLRHTVDTQIGTVRVSLDWVEFVADDLPHGVLFTRDTLVPEAVIYDDEIESCVPIEEAD